MHFFHPLPPSPFLPSAAASVVYLIQLIDTFLFQSSLITASLARSSVVSMKPGNMLSSRAMIGALDFGYKEGPYHIGNKAKYLSIPNPNTYSIHLIDYKASPHVLLRWLSAVLLYEVQC